MIGYYMAIVIGGLLGATLGATWAVGRFVWMLLACARESRKNQRAAVTRST